MNDQRKTKAELLDELRALRSRVASLESSLGARTRRAEKRLRDALWEMRDSNDLTGVLEAVRTSLDDLALDYQDCGVNLVEDGPGGVVTVNSISRSPDWVRPDEEKGTQQVRQFWESGRLVYRPDLEQDDPYSEREHLLANFGHEVRCVVDVPFSHGTLAVNSARPNAFGAAELAAIQGLATVLSEAFRRRDDLRHLEQRQRQLEEESADRILAEAGLLQSEVSLRQALDRERVMGRIRDRVFALNDLASFDDTLEAEWIADLRSLGIPVHRVSVQVPSSGKGDYDFFWSLLPRRATPPETDEARLSYPWVREAWESGRPVVVDRQRLAACGFWDQEVGSIVEIPLVGIGSLGVSCTQEKALDGAAVTALETFAGWLTTALQRLQYLQRLGDTAEELRRDIACEQAMARVRDQILELSALPDLWTYLQEHWTPALRRLGLSVYQISLEEPAARAGYYVRGWARYAVPGTAPQAEALLTTCPWVGEAWERGEPVLVSIERLRACAFPEEAVQSLVQLPLPGGGAIGISSTVPDAFDAAAVRILQGFAGLVSIARQRLLDLEAIRASRELLAATEQLAGIGGWAWEVSSQTMAWTDQTYRIHGMAPGDLPAGSPEHIARSLACYDAADRPVIEAAYRRCLAEGEPYELEVPFTTVDGRRLWVAIRGRAVMGEGGVARVVGHITDITDRRRMLRELADQRIRAAQVDRLQALGEMATGIAHELNQPLNGIRAFAEGLQIGVDCDWQVSPSELKKTMGEIVAQVDRITEIIDHMRAFARPEPDGEGRAFSVTEPIEGALKLMRAQLRVHGVAIQEEVAADLPAVSGRPHAIEQVILNLLSNARDALDERAGRQRGEEPGATPGWRPAVMIRAYAGADGSSVRVEVADNGDGIPPDAVDRLFEPFFTTKEVGKGTGIGLPIARGIVASHRGQIEVDNRPGDGATFVIVLPAAAS